MPNSPWQPDGALQRDKMRRRLTSRSALAVYTLVAGILLANVLYLGGVFKDDPSLHRSGLNPAGNPNVFPGDYTIDPNDGFTSQALGHLAAEEWLHGHVPYWNHYEGVGAPLAGEMQSAAMFPLVLLLILPNGLLYMHVLLELLAAVSTYLLLKRLGRSDAASTVAGLAFGLLGTFAWLANAAVNPIAFLPLLVLSVEILRGRAERHRRLGWTLMAVALALSLYAGFPEVAFLDALFVAGWATLRLFQLRAGDRLRFVGKLTAGALVGLALAAPILVAFADYLAAGAGAHLHGISDAALPWIGVSSLFIPYVYGPIWGFHPYDPTTRLTALWGSVGGFVTVTAFGLAMLSLWSRKDRGLKLFLALWALLATLKIYGFRPVGKAIDVIPGIGATAFDRYATVSVEFAMIVLAALVLDDLLDRQLQRRVLVIVGGLTTSVVAFLALRARPFVHTLSGAPHHRVWAALSAIWALGALSILIGAALVPAHRLRRFLILAIVGVDSVLMFVVPQFSASHVVALSLGPVRFLQGHLGSQRFYGLGPIEPNYGSFFRVASVDNNDAILPKSWLHHIPRYLDDNANPLVFTGVIVANPKGPPPQVEFIAHLAGHAAIGVTYVLEGRGAIPSDAVAQQGLTSVYVDHFFEILQLPNPVQYWHTADGAQCVVGRQDVTHAELDCTTGGSVIRLEQYMAGWRAVVNGAAVTVARSGDIFQKVPVHPGHNSVVFSFAPPYISIAWALFLLALIAGTWAAVASRERHVLDQGAPSTQTD